MSVKRNIMLPNLLGGGKVYRRLTLRSDSRSRKTKIKVIASGLCLESASTRHRKAFKIDGQTMIEGTPVAVHRCRFVDFTPSAVTALAFPPLPLPSVKGKQKSKPNKEFKFGTLAIGRANGNIELCEWTGSDREPQAPQAWVVRKVRLTQWLSLIFLLTSCIKTLVGPHPSKVDTLAFTLRDRDTLGDDEVPSLSQLRLFSAGGGSDLIEWDIERGCVQVRP